ncbi:MAG: TIGR01244 family sulfur transferase [Pseudorhodobacter sp.]
MDIRPLTPDYAVSPQIALEDMAAIKEAGFAVLIDNRPDAEISPEIQADKMREAAEAAGLTFVTNPVIGGAMTMDNVEVQGKAIAAATGPVLAYCASGNRSSQVWALSQAGDRPADELISIPARHGYQLEGLRGTLESLAGKK